jgi:predicted dehydrogenase
VRFGLLGTGYWADTCHAAGLAAHPDVELVAVWGRDPSRAAAVAERHGAAAEADLDALLDQVDAVAIAVPPDAQAGLARRAADAGRHLLLEKPLALDLEAADSAVSAVERAGVASVSFFTFRFMEPVVAWLRDAIASGGWDRATLTLLAPVLIPESPFNRSPWRHEHGALWDGVPHAVSLLLPVLGPVARVAATGGAGETARLRLEHVAGGVSFAAVSLTAPKDGACFRFELRGPAGLAELSQLGSPADAYARAVRELLDAIEIGTTPRCDIRFSADVVSVLAAAQRAQGGVARQVTRR